jgi:endoglucanase
LAWAAVWLYKATGEANYLNFAKGVYSQNGFTNNRDPLTWDSKVSGVKVLLAQITGDATYVNDVNTLCSYFINNIPKSPKGLIFFSEWGSLKQAAGAAYICLVVSFS